MDSDVFFVPKILLLTFLQLIGYQGQFAKDGPMKTETAALALFLKTKNVVRRVSGLLITLVLALMGFLDMNVGSEYLLWTNYHNTKFHPLTL